MIEIYIQFSIDSDECKGVIRIPIAQVLANLRVSSGSFQSVPSAQLNRPSFHDVILPVKADAATVSGLAR